MYRRLTDGLTGFARDERGATALEYGIIVSLVAVVIIAALTIVGLELQETFNVISTTMDNAVN